MSRLRPSIFAAVALGLAGCASAPMHYYTLMTPAGTAAPAPAAPAPYPFELLPVTVPAQVDLPQLVVRQGGQGVAVLQGQRWIAPLGDEVRGALSSDLTHDFRAQDVSAATELAPGLAGPTVSPLHREGWVAVRVMVPRDGS